MPERKDLKKTLVIICITYMTAAMLIMPSKTMAAAENALVLCANAVIPSVFPFIFCANMFISLGAAGLAGRYLSKIMRPLFNIPGSGAVAAVLGVISGYPVGAICASSLYSRGECTKSEAERMLAFCNNSGPMFIIGAVGVQMSGSFRIGVLLYIIHILSAFLTGIVFGRIKKEKTKTRALPYAMQDSGLKDAVYDLGGAIEKSVDSILKICGFVVIFGVFCAALPQGEVRPFVYSFFEITGGTYELLSKFGLSALPIISGIIAFSGVSVAAQVMSIIIPSGLSAKSYITGKLTQGGIAFLLTYIYLKIFPQTVAVFGALHNSPPYMPTTGQLTATSFITIALAAAAFLLIFIIGKILDCFK